MKPSSEERPWLAMAAEWTSRVTTLAGQMVLPVLAGLWLDRVAGTVWVFLVVGAILGFTSGMYQLVLWTRTSPPDRKAAPSEQSPLSQQTKVERASIPPPSPPEKPL